jgi:phytanoyl-CoA hydroxylase
MQFQPNDSRLVDVTPNVMRRVTQGEIAMITDTHHQQWTQQGYVIFEHLFDEQEMHDLEQRIDAFDQAWNQELIERSAGGMIGQGAQQPNQIVFSAFLNQKDAAIQQFAAQAKLATVAVALLGYPNIQLYFDQSVYKRPENPRDFPWHQDNGYAPIEPMHYLTCWIALNDATIENGCVWVLPGSHAQGLVEHHQTPIGKQCYFGDDPGTPVPLARGSMVAFSSLLFHRSGPNLSQGMRKAYILQYSAAGAIDPRTGKAYNNGPIVAHDGRPSYAGFYQPHG